MRSFDRTSSNTPQNSRPKSVISNASSNSRKPRPSEYLKAPTFFTPKTTSTIARSLQQQQQQQQQPQPKQRPQSQSISRQSSRSSLPAIPPRAPSRPPLSTRDKNWSHQNAPSLISTTTTTKPSAPRLSTSTRSRISSTTTRNMPVGGTDSTTSRPRQPQLSAAAARGIANRPPLTPKVATTKQPAISPLAARRAQSQLGTKDEGSTTPSGSPFLANVTSRTGARQSRVESANTTPSGTPNPDKGFDGWEWNKSTIGTPSNLTSDGVRANTLPEQSTQQQDADSKFVYASDARPTSQGTTQQRQAAVPQKPNVFFYANGTSEEARRTTSPPSGPSFTPVLVTTPEPTSTKFFYANGAPDYLQRPGFPASGSGSTVSTSSRTTNTRPTTGNSVPSAPSVTSRPMSPVKMAGTAASSPSLQGSAMPPGMSSRPTITSPPPLAPGGMPNGRRRVSIETPAREPPPMASRGHARAGSVPTFDQLFIPKNVRSPQSPDMASPPLSPGLSRPAMTMASLLQAADDLEGDSDTGDDAPQLEPSSPTKSSHSTDPVSELVANARRERKVQDLEITNASLEAINRTLERQLRKQTAELRRYRRLSRSGRFSIASGASSRVVSAAMTDPPADLSDLSEEDNDDLDSLHESDFSSDETASGDEPSSPNARMEARRKRDEIRLQLDLTKHQELLIDSQKINQSIKRCMDWTEVLIKEGQKALAYNVRVSDVELGGKVLAPPDEEDEADASFQEDADLNDSPTTLEPLTGKPPQDRDSGIELPVDGG